MKYEERIDDSRGIIFVKTTGTLIREKLGPAAAATRAKAKAKKYVLLFDFSESDNYLSLVDAVNWFKDYYDPIDTSLRHIRSAHLVGEQTEDFFQFVETAWLNRGGYIKVFRDEQSALEWLLDKERESE
ncbi:MAG: hypothetical protein AB2540_05970 [Candidatus Thiodiazotropha endolucinida]